MKMNQVVVEVRGGRVVEAYSDDQVQVTVIDWDVEEGDGNQIAFKWGPCSLAAMPDDTRVAFEQSTDA
jgi:hypothetical protein